MDNQDLTKYIEDYLNDVLPADKRIEFEHRLGTDKAFQQEVRLHKLLEGHLSDPGRWKHYSALEQAKKAPLPPDDKPVSHRTRYWKWASLLVLVLLAGVFFWQLSKPAAGLVSPPPAEEQDTESPAFHQLEESKEAPQEPAPAEQKPKKVEPIAEADPMDFIPNPSMEAFVNSGMKSENLDVKIASPQNDANFFPGKNDTTAVRFTGTVEGISEDEPAVFVLAIFNNRDGNKPLVSSSFELHKDVSGKMSFDLRQRLNLPFGLYYFFIEQQQGEMVYAGKFTIGKAK